MSSDQTPVGGSQRTMADSQTVGGSNSDDVVSKKVAVYDMWLRLENPIGRVITHGQHKAKVTTKPRERLRNRRTVTVAIKYFIGGSTLTIDVAELILEPAAAVVHDLSKKHKPKQSRKRSIPSVPSVPSDQKKKKPRKKKAGAAKKISPRSTNASGYIGVRVRGQRYYAQINKGGGKKEYIGSYDTAKQAAKDYDAAAIKLGRPLSKLNFPDKAPPDNKQ
jgi:hypothetical protein